MLLPFTWFSWIVLNFVRVKLNCFVGAAGQEYAGSCQSLVDAQKHVVYPIPYVGVVSLWGLGSFQLSYLYISLFRRCNSSGEQVLTPQFYKLWINIVFVMEKTCFCQLLKKHCLILLAARSIQPVRVFLNILPFFHFTINLIPFCIIFNIILSICCKFLLAVGWNWQ